ncbi:sialate O-acetylesterase [Candidatus Hydrogenedentota bacterium]
MSKNSHAVLALVATLLITTTTLAEVKPHALFTDGMVLQRNTEAPVWGTGANGEAVAVEFLGKKYSTTVKEGKWKVAITTPDDGGPFFLKISGSNTVEINDVLVGDVWVGSGQSNMAFGLKGDEKGKEAAAKAADPMLRLFRVKPRQSFTQEYEIDGKWAHCTPETAIKFSAVAYYFGRHLRENLDVPIGLISAPVGGTPAESWMSEDAIRDTPATRPYVDYFEERANNYDAEMAAYKKAFNEYKEAVEKARKEGLPNPSMPAAVRPMKRESVSRPSALFNGMIAPLIPNAIKGVIWYQGESNALLDPTYANYDEVFPALITDWRTQWGRGDFPFLFVLLPGYGLKEEERWVAVREAQIKALLLPNTALASAIDLGGAKELHPREKGPLGERMALSALGVAYGKDVPYIGPTYDSVIIESGKATVKFTNTHGGLKLKAKELGGFLIAGGKIGNSTKPMRR